MANPLPEQSEEMVACISGQPELFSVLGIDPDVVSAAQTVAEHNGNTTLKHHRDAAAIISALSLGWSDRRIARELQHGEKTVRAIRLRLTKDGKLTAAKEVALDAAGQSLLADVELGNELLEEIRTLDGDARAKLLAGYASLRRAEGVRAGILADKGGSGRPALVQVNVSAGSVVQVVEDYAARLADLPSVDPTSIGFPSKSATPAVVLPGDAVGDVVSVQSRSSPLGDLDRCGTGVGGVGSGQDGEDSDGKD